MCVIKYKVFPNCWSQLLLFWLTSENGYESITGLIEKIIPFSNCKQNGVGDTVGFLYISSSSSSFFFNSTHKFTAYLGIRHIGTMYIYVSLVHSTIHCVFFFLPAEKRRVISLMQMKSKFQWSGRLTHTSLFVLCKALALMHFFRRVLSSMFTFFYFSFANR